MTDPTAAVDLRARSTRTLAWLGDVEFERLVRRGLAELGDHAVDRLDTARARVVRAEAQAALLERISPALTEAERAVVARGRNATVRASGRAARDTRAYRAATGLEALVGWWSCGRNADERAEAAARRREVLEPALHELLREALEGAAPPRRG